MNSARNIAIAICAITGFGCGGTSSAPTTQVITGTITTANAIAVRAVVGTQVVTAGQVRSDGSFVLSLPAGQRYRLEVLDTNGVHHLVTRTGTTYADVAFTVCQPGPPHVCGGIGTGDPSGGGSGSTPGCDPTTGANCGPDGGPQPPKCDPNDPSCTPPPPPPGCDPTTDPNCAPPPPKCTDPTDPACPPPPSPCSADGTCPPGTCTDATDPTCPPPPPPCADPSDPTTCKDPCMDPASCGCASTDPNCWPAPSPCDATGTNCAPGGGSDGGMMPDNPPGDIGCETVANAP